MSRGWRGEKYRHGMAARGIRTKFISRGQKKPKIKIVVQKSYEDEGMDGSRVFGHGYVEIDDKTFSFDYWAECEGVTWDDEYPCTYLSKKYNMDDDEMYDFINDIVKENIINHFENIVSKQPELVVTMEEY